MSVRMDGLSAKMLSRSHAIIFNIVHSEIHHENFELGKISLRDLLDLVLMARLYSTSPDWSCIRARMAEHGLARVAESYAHMAHKLLGIPLPEGFVSRAGTASHYARCLWLVGWPRVAAAVPVVPVIRVLRLFNAQRMRKRFGCSESGLGFG